MKIPKKAYIESLDLELTRRCNMACQHCLRGGAQAKDISRGIIDSLLAGISGIGSIIFTGGEPSLNPGAMAYVLEKCRVLGIDVPHVWLATNGKRVSDEFLQACRGWQEYCLECGIGYRKDDTAGGYALREIIRNANDMDSAECGCFVALSIDPYHEDIPAKNVYRLLTLPHVTLEKFVDPSQLTDNWVLPGGRAKTNQLVEKSLEQARPWMFGEQGRRLSVEDCGEYLQVEGMYVSSDGSVLANADYSYAEMKKHTVFRIDAAPGMRGRWTENLEKEAETA